MLLEEGLDDVFHIHPLVLIELVRKEVLVLFFIQLVATEFLEEDLVEFLLDASHSEVDIVFGLVNGIEGGTTIKKVLALFIIPEANLPHSEYTLTEENQIIDRNVLVNMWLFIKLWSLLLLMDCEKSSCYSHQGMYVVEHQIISGLLRKLLNFVSCSKRHLSHANN